MVPHQAGAELASSGVVPRGFIASSLILGAGFFIADCRL